MSLIERVDARQLSAAGPNGPEAIGRPFEIGFDDLARRGFYRPSEKPARLALEMRAIKRRLLRRLSFKKPGERRRPRGNEGVVASRQRNVVLVTSTRPGEGKTFTATNLALSLALEEKIGTVLIDADVPRPKVRGQLDLPDGPGLTDLIERRGEVRLRDCLWRAENAPLCVLTEGTASGTGADLFSREETGRVIRDVSARFSDRLVIIDAPPVLATPEAVILARHADEVCFVIEANGTPEQAVAVALDELLDVTDRISVVLNKCLVAGDAVHYGSYEEYYYKQDKGRG